MVIQVAVAVIEDGMGRVLLSRRPAEVHLGGLWEFPGGKLEPGETLSQALCREIQEELGLVVLGHRPLIRIRHRYPEKEVQLLVERVTCWQGEPQGREGQSIAWVTLDQIDRYPLPPADGPIVRAMMLPEQYLITGDATQASFLPRFKAALERGIRLIQIRPFAGAISADQIRAATEMATAYGATLLLNSRLLSDGDDFPQLGLHLTSADLMELKQRPERVWAAASCHDAQQLIHASSLGLDFAVLSPVLPTTSHPEATPLGWSGFTELVDQAALPVYALGGMGGISPEEVWAHGGQGIAAIRGLW